MLTDSQLRKIEEKRLQVRPSFYRALTREEEAVSTDFESFAILADTALREDLIDRLSDIEAVDTDTLAIHARARKFERIDAEAQLSDYVRATQEVTQFQLTLRQSPLSGSAQELALVQQDLLRTQGRVLDEHDAHFYRRNVVNVLDTLADRANNPDTQKQIQSWVPVLRRYA